MPKTRRQYTGNAVSTTITGNLAAGGLSVAIASDTGWPSAAPFYVVIDPGTASEEKMYVSAKSTLTLTVTRGQDGTSDVQHSTGATIYPVFTSIDADEANELTSKYTTRGDIVYQGASTFERLAKGTQHHVLRAGASDPEYGLITNNNVDASAAIALSKLATGALPTAITVNSDNIVDGSIVNADINASAAIALSKLANVTAGQVVLGNASNVPTATALSGDVTVNSSGVTAIGSGVIVNDDINASAAIVDTKLATIATADKVSVSALNIDGATDIGADLADADLVIVDDGAGGTNRKSAISRFAKYLFGKVSGDITVTEAGVATTKNWTTWTVTFSNITQTSYTARYIQLGKTVHFLLSVTLGSGGISSSAHSMSLPVAAQSQNALTGLNAIIYDNTASRYLCTTVGLTTSTIGLLYQSGLLGECSQVDGSNPIDTQTGDQIIIHGTYEAA